MQKVDGFLNVYEMSNDGFKFSQILKIAEGSYNARVYDSDDGSFKAYDKEFDCKKGSIGVFYNSNKKKHVGFIKNIQDGTFKVSDLRGLFDTEVLLDFSHETNSNFLRWDNLIKRVNEQIKINNESYLIEFIVPNFLADTKAIADYTGQYIIVNAYTFLKVYLLYYNFYIKADFDESNKKIIFEYKKSENSRSIYLSDFVHEKTSNDIKTNKTVATISYSTIKDIDPKFEEITKTEYDSISPSNKSDIVGDLPAADDFPLGYGIANYLDKSWVMSSGSYNDVINVFLKNKLNWTYSKDNVYQKSLDLDLDLIYSPLVQDYNYSDDQIKSVHTNIDAAKEAIRLVLPYYVYDLNIDGSLAFNSKIRVLYNGTFDGASASYTFYYTLLESSGYVLPYDLNYIRENLFSYLPDPSDYDKNKKYKINAYFGEGISSSQKLGEYYQIDFTNIIAVVDGSFKAYYKIVGKEIVPRPLNMPTYNYYLGSDNQIYENEVPDDKKIMPVVTKFFEDSTLANAQIEAVYHLLSNRWTENVLINNNPNLIDLEEVELYSMINVYDKNNYHKVLPVVEKYYQYKDYEVIKIKLGFKKTSFTEIIKNDVAKSDKVIKNSKTASVTTNIEYKEEILWDEIV